MNRARRELTFSSDDSGFTLIELLIVLVILPALIGTVAVVLIVSLNNTAATSNRLSDSVNAEASSAFFIRDTQGATFVTTDQALFNAASTYNATSPVICGTTPQPGFTLTLLVALYHPAELAGSTATVIAPALDVGYWLQSSGSGVKEVDQIIRYSCTGAASVIRTVVTDVPAASATGNSTSGTLTLHADLTPSTQTSSAANGWIPTTAFTTVTATSSVPGTITVFSSANFNSGTITATTVLGTATLGGCSVSSGTAISCTTASGASKLFPGESLFQDSVTGISLTAIEPATNYHFAVTGAPRTSSSAQTLMQPQNIPALITLATGGILVQDHNDALQVAGSVEADGSQVNCSGNAKNGPLASVTGSLNATSSGSSCVGVGPATVIGDPIAQLLPPTCFPVLGYGGPDPNHLNTWEPGRYPTPTTPGPLTSGALDPGVYELDAGISASATLTLSPNASAGQGVLLYFPGSGSGTGCATAVNPASPPSVPAGLNLPPLGSGPLPAVFANNAEMRNMWLWQDATNSQPINWTSVNQTADSVCPTGTPEVGEEAGLAYLPSADLALGGSSYIHTGALAAGSVTAFGDNNVNLSGLLTCSS